MQIEGESVKCRKSNITTENPTDMLGQTPAPIFPSYPKPRDEKPLQLFLGEKMCIWFSSYAKIYTTPNVNFGQKKLKRF